MNTHACKTWGHNLAAGVIVLAAVGLAGAQNVPAGPVPIPKVTGPIPETAESRPWLAGKYLMTPIDMAESGYVEEEYFISGTANVYDWLPSGMTVRASNLSYTTRILVRRPANQNRFSGSVMVEGGNNMPGQGWEVNSLWSNLNEHVRDRGHIWVSVTIIPGTAAALKVYDPTRYASISFPRPISCGAEAAGRRGGPPARPEADAEGGISYDILSQTAALLKSPSTPLTGFNAQYVYLVMQSGGHMPTYISGFHKLAILANGKPAYDGYLQKESGSAGPTSRCSPPFQAGDPRTIPRNVGVPIIHVEAQSYAQSDPVRRLALRREDSDTPQDRYRLYEVAGASHLDRQPYRFIPVIAEQRRTGGGATPVTSVWPWNYACAEAFPMNSFPQYYLLAGALSNLDEWVRNGAPPPRAERIAIRGTGAQAAVALDRFKNAVGGVRTPWVDVPVAEYRPNRGPSQCTANSSVIAFDYATLDATYGSYSNYQKKALEAVDRLIKERWVTAEDGAKIRAEFNASPRVTSLRR